jgi:prevent-host-death family protein
MSSVGLRELKNRLSEYVARAKGGEAVSITDRGRVVAELIPPKRHPKTGEPLVTLDDLRRKGILHGGGANHSSLYPAMPRILKRSSSTLLDEERGSR